MNQPSRIYDFENPNYLTRYLVEATQKKNSFKQLRNVDKTFILNKCESFGNIKSNQSLDVPAAGAMQNSSA